MGEKITWYFLRLHKIRENVGILNKLNRKCRNFKQIEHIVRDIYERHAVNGSNLWYSHTVCLYNTIYMVNSFGNSLNKPLNLAREGYVVSFIESLHCCIQNIIIWSTAITTPDYLVSCYSIYHLFHRYLIFHFILAYWSAVWNTYNNFHLCLGLRHHCIHNRKVYLLWKNTLLFLAFVMMHLYLYFSDCPGWYMTIL